MRSIATVFAALLLCCTLSVASMQVAAAPLLRIFGHGKPSAKQRQKYAYMYNGREVSLVKRPAVVNQSKNR